MIPIKDLNPTSGPTPFTRTIILLNVIVFIYEISLGADGMQAFVFQYGVIPQFVTDPTHIGSLVTPLTSMFLHGGWMHLIGNMWFLWIFGDNLEDRLGKTRFVIFYLLGGIGAAAAQIFMNPSSSIPMVGASGAISAVLAGYVVLYPRAQILTLAPLPFFGFFHLPAFLFIFVWFGMQLIYGAISLGALERSTGGVAWYAHIGGFVVGFILIRFFSRRKPNSNQPSARRPLRESKKQYGKWKHVDRNHPDYGYYNARYNSKQTPP